MSKKVKKTKTEKGKKKTGLPPGSIVYTGDRVTTIQTINVLQYNLNELKESHFKGYEGVPMPNDMFFTWYDIAGVDNVKLLELIGKTFHIHPLALEDIANVYQRPKFEEYESGFLFVLPHFAFNPEEISLQREQLSIYVGADFIITFQEDEIDTFLSVKDFLRYNKGKARQKKGDYLAYLIIDYVVDKYSLIIENMDEEIENLETAIIVHANPEIKDSIYQLKRESYNLKKTINAVREAVYRFKVSENHLVNDITKLFVRDLEDHANQAVESLDMQRDNLIALQDLFMSEISHKMNNVMKVLTVISSIFIPLTFLAGIYGMNFDNMPELHWKYGYFILLGFMTIVAALMVWYFKRKDWL